MKQDTAEAIKAVQNSNAPIIITQNGEAKAILLDIAQYEQEPMAMLKLIAQSNKNYASGKFKTVKKVFSGIRKSMKDSQI